MLCVRWSPSLRLAQDGGQLSDFIDGLGPGQLVGRQVLGAPALGDIQLSMCYQKGYLEVEVIRARGLQARQGSKVLPGKLGACKHTVCSQLSKILTVYLFLVLFMTFTFLNCVGYRWSIQKVSELFFYNFLGHACNRVSRVAFKVQ